MNDFTENQLAGRRLLEIERIAESATRGSPRPLRRPSFEMGHELLELLREISICHAFELLDRAERLARDIAAGHGDTIIRARLTALAVDVARAAEGRNVS